MSATQHDYIKIKTAYFTDKTVSLDKVAEQFGIHPSYLRRVAAEQKWNEERDKIWELSNKKVTEHIPDDIVKVKLRHLQIAKVMQGKMLEKIKQGKIDSSSTYRDLKVAIDIERDAIGLNDKKQMDEELERMTKFAFLLSLKPDELRRFIESAKQRGIIASDGNSSVPVADPNEKGE